MAAPPPTKKNVLDLEVRRRIVEAVEEHPGLHMRALAERLELPVSTLEYHTYQLLRHDRLAAREAGGYKAFYPVEGMDRRDKDVLYVVRHEAPRRICTHLLLHPGDTPKEVREVLGIPAPTLSFHLKRLRRAGLLDEEPAGRTKHLSIVDPERVANVLVTYQRSFLDDAVDRFASAWLELNPPVEVAVPSEAEGGDAESQDGDAEGRDGGEA